MWESIGKLTDKWINESRLISKNPKTTLEDVARAKALLQCAEEITSLQMESLC